MLRFALLAGLAAPVAAGPARAQDLTEEDVKRLALEAILERPEVVMEAVEILRAREAEAQAAAAAEALATMRAELEAGEDAPVLGNPEGSVTMVEFFDYNCPYCRRAAQDVAALIETDPDLRVVYREWPILGEASVVAARASLAAHALGGAASYEAFHTALMAAPGRIDEAAVEAAAAEAGLDVERLREGMEAPEVAAHIEASMRMAEALGISGTPAFVVGAEIVPGAVPREELAALVEEARAAE